LNARVWIVVLVVAVCTALWFAFRGKESSTTVAAPPVEDARQRTVVDERPVDSARSREPAIGVEPAWIDPTLPDTEFDETKQYNVRVLDPDGEPVAHAEVVLTTVAEPSTASAKDHVARVFTDAAGVAGLSADGFTGDWTLVAQDEDHASSGVCTAASFPGGVRGDFDLQLFELVTVRGRVIDDMDLAVPTARVAVAPSGSRLFSGTPPVREGIEVDDQGRFECRLEATGTSFLFRAERFGGEACEASVSVGRDGVEDVVLRFPLAAELSGLVLDERNRPAARATVHLLRYDDEGQPVDRRNRRQAVTDDSGRFRFEVAPAGVWYLVASADGGCSSDPLHSSETVGGARSIVLRLAPCTTIAGEVVDGEGAPLEGVMVAAVTDLDREPERYELHGGDNELVYPLAFAESGADGGFLLEGVRSGNVPYRLMFIADSTQRDRVVEEHGILPGTADLRVVLTDERLLGGVLEARVTVEGRGEVLESGVLFLYERSLQGAWVAQAIRSFEGGVARREGLKPGREYCASVQPVADHLLALIPTWTAELGVHEIEIVMPLARSVDVPVPAEVATSGTLDVVGVDPHPAESESRSAPISNGVARFNLRPGSYSAQVAGVDAFEFEVTSAYIALSINRR
jgi:carboxypeptidase family protein